LGRVLVVIIDSPGAISGAPPVAIALSPAPVKNVHPAFIECTRRPRTSPVETGTRVGKL
jgi:hypothetical protein